jgi:ubiquinone biosynthesis protein
LRIEGVSERRRVMQVYGVLFQYGTDVAFDRNVFGGFRRRLQQWLWRPAVPLRPLAPETKVRLLLQDLGPTYVKLGQIVSSQGRALPLAWEQELSKLQSDVRPFPYEAVRSIITESLGTPPETLYESFDPTPLAAASLAQVHRATMHDGRPVAVKVQRPNIHEQLRSDVRILMRAAALLERRVAWAEDVDLAGVIHEFGTSLLRELDYTIEAYNARRLERVLEPIGGLHVPSVEPACSSDRVLTLEFIDGVKPTDTDAIDAAGLDRRELVERMVRGAIKMVLIDGFFHGDPHPGNVAVELDTGRLTLMDTGMVGELALRKRVSLISLLVVSRNRDVTGLATTLRSLSTPFRDDADERAYRQRFERQLGPLMDPPPGQPVPMQKVIQQGMDVLRDSGYRLDAQLTLAIKAMAQAEAITAALTPEARGSDFATMAVDALAELVPGALNEETILAAARKQAMSIAGEVAQRMPSVQDAAFMWIDQFQKGRFQVKVDLTDLDRPVNRLGRMSRVIAVAVLITGTMIASALAAGVSTHNGFMKGLAHTALVLYAASATIAVVLIAVLIWSLLRRPRRRRRRLDIS